MTPRVLVKKLRPDAIVPQYMTPGAAGLDLSIVVDEPVTLRPGERHMFDTGLAFEIPPGFEGSVRPRSGLSRDHAITIINSPGTLDSDYRGSLRIVLINHGHEPFTVEESGLRVAQMVIAPVARAELVEVEELSGTARGAGGYGSTGR